MGKIKYVVLFLLICASLCKAQMYNDTPFNNGFKEGFKEGYCYQNAYCFPPYPPYPPYPKIGVESSESYKDGYNNGFEAGRASKLNEESKRNGTQQNSPKGYQPTITNPQSTFVPIPWGAYIGRENSKSKVKEKEPRFVITDNNMYTKGKDDGFKYYKGYKKPAIGTIILTTCATPCCGVIPLFSLGNEVNVNGKYSEEIQRLMLDPNYMQGFKDTAKKRKIGVMLTSYGVGCVLFTGILLGFTYGGNLSK